MQKTLDLMAVIFNCEIVNTEEEDTREEEQQKEEDPSFREDMEEDVRAYIGINKAGVLFIIDYCS